MDHATLGLIAAAALCASAALVLAVALIGGALDWLRRDALHRRMARDIAARRHARPRTWTPTRTPTRTSTRTPKGTLQ